MINDRLDFLLRINKGKDKLSRYDELFLYSGFVNSDSEYIDLETSDLILERIRQIFPPVDSINELLLDNQPFNSGLLTLVLNSFGESCCYLFTDDVYYCGMYLIKTKLAISNCLTVAKNAYNNTCFLLDVNYQFSFTINCNENANFDVQGKLIETQKFKA